MSGHVFIAEGDVRRFACDGWLLPTDRAGMVELVWTEGEPRLQPRVEALRGSPALASGERTTPLPGQGQDGPLVRAVDTGGVVGREPDWYVEGFRQGVGALLRDLPSQPRNGRERHLIAVPLIGIAAGMGGRVAGEIITAQLKALFDLLDQAERPVDIAVLVRGKTKLAAAQQARRMLRGRSDTAWPDLDPGLREKAEELGGQAADRRLVLFIGAGVSIAAGLPGWSRLLERLAQEANLGSEDLEGLNRLDQARVIRDVLGKNFAATMSATFDGATERSLAHQMLASLPVTEAATTNYDTLFEAAWRDCGTEVAVLPRKGAVLSEPRWLLKLHGTIEEPEALALTRDDYMRMDREGSALAGVVQALLITRRMLFVGYSLDDDRFHQIAHDARVAVGSREQRPDSNPFGTALLPEGKRSVERLWEGEIDIIGFGGQRGDDPAASRRIEIFLDCVLANSDDPASYLNDEGFRSLWSAEEVDLARLLEEALDLAQQPGAGPAAESVAQHLRRMLAKQGDDSPPRPGDQPTT